MQNYKQTNRFLSNQAKQALVYAMLEAKKNKLDSLTSKYMFYGLIKSNPSLLNKIILKLYKKNGCFSEDIKTLLYRCQISFKSENNLNPLSSNIILSKKVRNLLYSLLRTSKNKDLDKNNKKNFIVVTTFSIFIALLKSKSIKIWLKDEIFFRKKIKKGS